MYSQTPFDFASLSNSKSQAPLCVQQAVSSSYDLSWAYLRDHVEQLTGLTPVLTAHLAMARFEWILQSTRRELSGIFSEAEIYMLLDCYRGELFFPGIFDDMACDLCDHLGLDLTNIEEPQDANLVKKLREMTPSQRATLADALEQTLYRGLKSDQSVEVFLATLGITLV